MAMTTASGGIYIGQGRLVNRSPVSRLVHGGTAVRAGVGQVGCSVRVIVVGIDMIDVSIVVNVYVLVWELVNVVGTSLVSVKVIVVDGGTAVRAGVRQVGCSVRVIVVGIDMIDVSIVVNVYVLVWELVNMVGTSLVSVKVIVVVIGVLHFTLERLDTKLRIKRYLVSAIYLTSSQTIATICR